MRKINLLNIKGLPILEQLKLEEALLRADESDWCLINTEAPPSIVLGISAVPERFVDKTRLEMRSVPLIRRFSGGGTVFVDEETLFVTFIFNSASTPDKALQWSEQFYLPIFSPLPFRLKENDYTIFEKKCGGNAQYFRKNRFLHHTSFLFDYKSENMELLRFPEKTPKYRSGRSHDDFLMRLKDHFVNKNQFIETIRMRLDELFSVKECVLEDVMARKELPHRKSTERIDLSN